MSRTFKITLILLVVASVTSAALAVFAFMGKEREYAKRLTVESKLIATLRDKKRLDKELDLSKNSLEESKTKITEIEKKIKESTLQIEKEKHKSRLALSALVDRKRKIAKLKLDLERKKKEKLDISKKLDDLQFDYERAKLDVSRLKDEKIKLANELSALKEGSVELDKIVVTPPISASSLDAAIPARELLKGKVLVVNRDYSFVVTDLGQDDGVKEGMIFEIRDGNNPLGNIEIDKVYDTIASATVPSSVNINSIRKGNLLIESH